jgi:glutamate racemase
VVSVVEPGARALSIASQVRRVGVIGTVGTISSGAYQRALAEEDATLQLIATACPGFVEFVERGQTSGDEVMLLAERLLAPVVDAGIDALLLGCTHYPYLSRVISEVMGPDVVLVSSADETAFALASMLRESKIMASSNRKGTHTFLSSGDVEWFADFGRRLLGPELSTASRWSRGVTD